MLIDRFLKAGREFLGCEYPIMCGAMTWVSDPQLVSAIGNAGGFGLLAGGNTPIDVFERQIVETGENVLLLRVDTPVGEEAMEDLMDLPNVNSVQLLNIL